MQVARRFAQHEARVAGGGSSAGAAAGKLAAPGSNKKAAPDSKQAATQARVEAARRQLDDVCEKLRALDAAQEMRALELDVGPDLCDAHEAQESYDQAERQISALQEQKRLLGRTLGREQVGTRLFYCY